jgi:hypothetical protein
MSCDAIPLHDAPTGARQPLNASAWPPTQDRSKNAGPRSRAIQRQKRASLESPPSSKRRRNVDNPERHIPPAQEHYRIAAEKAVESLKDQPHEQLIWLGAKPDGDLWTLKTLGDTLTVGIQTGSVRTAAGKGVREAWQILVLHYLAITSQPIFGKGDLTFAEIPGAITYDKVYQGRVIGRLCHTAGRDANTLTAAAVSLDGRDADGGDKAFDFRIFPQLNVKLIWYAADDEFPPSATILLPENIFPALSIEDIVVLSEQFVARLSGKSLGR